MLQGRGGIGRITRFDPSPYESQMAGEVKDFDPTKYMDKKDARRTDRFAQLATAAASQALTDSKLDVAKEPERVGVSIATGVGGLGTLVEQVLVMEKRGPSPLSPFMVPMLMATSGSAPVPMPFGLQR